jgi:hypothetical protein
MSTENKIEEFAGKTIAAAIALARRYGFTTEPVFKEISGPLCVVRFEKPAAKQA